MHLSPTFQLGETEPLRLKCGPRGRAVLAISVLAPRDLDATVDF
jgi:hypothetical protein